MNSLGYFVTIDPDECRRLIGDAVVGRVSWLSKSRGLQVLPVNFVLVNDRIVFRVAQGSVLEELTQPVEVAFQVDDLDGATATGWAVLVQGTTASWDGDLRAISAWAPGERDLGVAITPTAWSGRSVSAEEA